MLTVIIWERAQGFACERGGLDGGGRGREKKEGRTGAKRRADGKCKGIIEYTVRALDFSRSRIPTQRIRSTYSLLISE